MKNETHERNVKKNIFVAQKFKIPGDHRTAILKF